MSELFKDNKDFEFIKEQVLPKKRKKFRKWIIPFFMTILMALVFGLVAAVTFCIAEPRLYKLLHKDETNPFAIPTPALKDDEEYHNDDPEDNPGSGYEGIQGEDDKDNKSENQDNQNNQNNQDNQDVECPNEEVDVSSEEEQPVIVEAIDADIDDYLAIHNDIKKLTYETGKSIMTVSSIISGTDWFGNPIERRIYTSGVIVDNNGTQLKLLVSLDRVKDASSINLEINENISVNAVLHDYETELNLAIIAVNIVDIPARALGDISVAHLGESYNLTVGSPIIAMGNPNGYSSSIDMGIVTSKGSKVSITDNELDLFNTNMIFNKESDGVVVNFKGEVIGLITRTLKNDLNKELSTVIGISKLKSYIDRMIKQTPRIYCGVIAENLPQTALKEYNVPSGIYIYEVINNSPAFKAGLMSGDIILNVENRTIFNMNNFYSAISEYEPGTEATLKIKRTSGSADKEMELRVTLGDKKQ